MTWHPITTPAHATALMKLVNNFHDGCIREAHVWTQQWVNADNLAMRIGNGLGTSVRLLIQRQFHPFSAIELLFNAVTSFHLSPAAENCDGIIFDATFLFQDEIIYWADINSWDPGSPNQDTATWISARRLHWRDASEWMGPQLRYGPADGNLP